MNIFMVDSDAVVAAQSLNDRHVTKMCLESSQILSTAHRVLDGTVFEDRTKNNRKIKRYKLDDGRDAVLYKATHINHPSSKWARETSDNYKWLFSHWVALGEEYTHRYGRQHLTIIKLQEYLSVLPNNILIGTQTVIPCCMDEQYILPDPIESYRNYYKYGKARLNKYTNRTPPAWL